MAKIERFEDVEAWQEARKLVNRIYTLTREKDFSRDFALRDQIRRASGSVMHNIAEGFGAGSDKEFVRFLRYALRSAIETQSQLYTALDQKYVSQKAFEDIYQHVEKTKGKIHGFIGYLIKSQSRKVIKENSINYLFKDDTPTS